MEAVVLDANVLYSNTLRGFFLWMSKSKIYRPIWSAQIWDEVFRNRSGDEAEKKKFKTAMEETVFLDFADSMCSLSDGFERVDLPDPDDEHIVALARQEKAAAVVTFNLKDFPADRIGPVSVKAVHPDEFLCGLFDTKKDLMKSALSAHLESLTRSKPGIERFIESFKNANAPRFADCLTKENASGNLIPEVWS